MDGRANPLLNRKVVESLSLSLSLSVSLCLLLLVSLYLSLSFFRLSLPLSPSLSLSLPLSPSLSLSFCLSPYLPYLSICLSVCLPLCLYVYLSICLRLVCCYSLQHIVMHWCGYFTKLRCSTLRPNIGLKSWDLLQPIYFTRNIKFRSVQLSNVNPSIYLLYLSIYLSVSLPICLSICLLSICLSVYLSTCLPVSICQSIYLSACLPICLSIYLSVSLSICLSTYCLSFHLSICLSLYLSTAQLLRVHWGVLTIFTSQCARACAFWTSQLSKVAQDPQFLSILTSKCASTHCHVHFLSISTSKSAPRMVLCTFWLQHLLGAAAACLFRHLTFQNFPRLKCFDRFYFQVCFKHLHATMACNFWSLIWPAVSAPAPLESLLLEPPEPQNIEQTQCLATFLPCRAPLSSFYYYSLFLLTVVFLWLLSPLLLHLSISWKFDF